MPTKFQDDWFINSWEILTFRPLEKEEKGKEKTIIEVSKFLIWKLNKNFRKFESFQGGFLGNNKPKIGRCLQKNYDDWSISGWEIEERRFRHNIPCAPSPWCCPWGSSDGRNEFSRIYISCILIYKEKKKFDDDVLCRASPWCCSRGSPGGWREKSFLQNL